MRDIDSNDPVIQGRAYARQGDLNKAIQIFEQGVRQHPDQIPIRHHAAMANFTAGNYAAAIKDLNVLLAGSRGTMLHALRGLAYARMGNNKQGLQDAQASVDKLQCATCYNILGMIYYLNGDNDSAIEQFNSAIQKAPDFSGAYLNRSLAFRKSGKLELADADARKSQTLGLQNNVLFYDPRVFYAKKRNQKPVISSSRCSLRIGERENCPPNTIKIALDKNTDLKKKTFTMVRLGFIGKGMIPRNDAGDIFRAQLSQELMASQVQFVPIKKFDAHFAKKCANSDCPYGEVGFHLQIAREVGANILILGQAFVEGEAGATRVKQASLFIRDATSGDELLRIDLINADLSPAKAANLINQYLSLRIKQG